MSGLNSVQRMTLLEQFALLGIPPISGGSQENDGESGDGDGDDGDGDGEEGDGQPDGKAKEKTFTFTEKSLSQLLSRKQRAWERNILPTLKADIAEELKAELSKKPNGDGGNDAQALLDRVLAGDTLAIPRTSLLGQKLSTTEEKLRQIEQAAEEELDEELEALSDDQKALVPTNLSVTEQLTWVRKYKKTIPTSRKSRQDKTPGNNPSDPDKRVPGAFDARATKDDLKRRIRTYS